MDRALIELFRLRLRGGLRRKLNQLKTLRGMLCFVVGVGVMGMCLVAGQLDPIGSEVPGVITNIPPADESTREVLPFFLLAACFLTIATTTGPAIYFSPAEVNFLFAGPFSRRSLLLYKFLAYAVGALMSATIITLFLPRYAGGRPSAFVGSFFALIFVQLFSASVGLIGQSIGQRVFTRVRRAVLLTLLLLVAWGLWQAAQSATEQGLVAMLGEFRNSPLGSILVAPVDVFVRAFAAESLYPDLLVWGLAALAIDGALLGILIWADANYFEAAALQSQRLYQRWQRARRGGLVWSSSSATAAWRLPMFPQLAGTGPIAWRQLTTALRASGRALVVVLIASIAGGPLLAWPGAGDSWTKIAIVVWATVFVLPRVLNFDFRNDQDHLAELKAMPISPRIVAIGQLLAPVLILSVFHLTLLVGAVICTDGSVRGQLLAIIPFVLPMNVLLFGVENLMFLLFPTRMVPMGRLDFEFFGRILVEFSVKCFALAAACCLAVVAGMAVYLGVIESWAIAGSVAWLTLCLTTATVIPCLAWAYRRFDVSLHSPVE